MPKKRIFQVAKELNISHKDILNFLKEKYIKVTSHMATIDDETYVVLNSFAIKVPFTVAFPLTVKLLPAVKEPVIAKLPLIPV